MLAIGGSRKLIALTLSSAFLIFLWISGNIRGHTDIYIHEDPSVELDIIFHQQANPSQRRKHVVIASQFPAHFDVYLAAARTFRDVLGAGGTIDVFPPRSFDFGFQDIIDQLGLFAGEIKNATDLISAMTTTNFYPSDPGAMVDLLLLGTCEMDMRIWSTELLAAWDARPADKKFIVVCIVHHFRDTAWQSNITPWAARGALRLLPIAKHVGKAFRARFKELADDPNPDIYNAMYEYIDIDVHAPVLDLPDYGVRSKTRKLSRAAIQGSFDPSRRDYEHIFGDLLSTLKSDSLAWGYVPLSDEREQYLPDPNAEDEPFTLHLLGYGYLDVPKELGHIVILHVGLDYGGFYADMQSMDIIVPAFVNIDYYDFQASSTVAMAVECDVPILASKRMRKAYGYIDDDRVTVTRPQALREIPAIQVLRDGFYTRPNASDVGHHDEDVIYVDEFLDDIDAMLRGGWRRSPGAVRAYKLNLWAQNRAAIGRIVDDLPGVL